MIISKGMSEVSGYLEYRYGFEHSYMLGITEEDQDTMFESTTFHSLRELLEKIQPEALEEVKDSYDADRVWISGITFSGKSDDGETTSELSFFESKSRGHASTKISNDDIQERAFLNMKKIKQIVDNTVEQYPIRYK